MSAADATILGNVVTAAKADGIEVLATAMNFGSKTTPLTRGRPGGLRRLRRLDGEDRDLRHLIVGNEPNLNRYWLPQYDADGSDAAAAAYESLLAQTYDAVKAVDPTVEVIGGALSPRGSDRPGTGSVPPTRPPRSSPTWAPRTGERPAAADHGRALAPPVRGPLERRAGRRHAPEHDDDRARGLREARRPARSSVRRHRTGGLDAAALLRRVRRRVADPGRRSRRCTPAPRSR